VTQLFAYFIIIIIIIIIILLLPTSFGLEKPPAGQYLQKKYVHQHFNIFVNIGLVMAFRGRN